jgi:hypothetical protein
VPATVGFAKRLDYHPMGPVLLLHETLRGYATSLKVDVAPMNAKVGAAAIQDYSTTRAQSPTIQASVSDTRAHYAFVIDGVSNQPGSTINLRVPAEGGSLIITNVGSTGASSVNLKMTRETEQGVRTFSHNAIPLMGADTAELQFGNWTNNSEGIPLVTTHNGQQSTQRLTNQQRAN